MKNLLLILFLLSFQYVFPVPDDTDIIMKIDEGVINITGKTALITATGTPSINISNINTARIDAEKMARKNLRFRLEKAFSKIILENGVNLGKHLSSKKDSDFFTGLIKDDDPAEIISSRYFSDGTVEIEYSVPIVKFFEQIKLKTMPDICKDEKKQTAFPEEMEGVADSRKEVLIIEIKSSKLDPALYLTLENEKGELIYSSCLSGTVPSIMVKKDPSRFLEVLNSKESFLTVSAIKVKNGSTVVIGSADAEKIVNEIKRSSLKEGKVIFLIKEKEGK